MTKHYTMGDKIIKMEKILEYLLEDKLYKDYLKSLEHKSGGGFSFFPTPEGWKAYKKDKLNEVFKWKEIIEE